MAEYFCAVCSEDCLNGYEKRLHEATIKHQQTLHKSDHASPWECNLCRFRCKSTVDYSKHVASEEHQSRVARYQMLTENFAYNLTQNNMRQKTSQAAYPQVNSWRTEAMIPHGEEYAPGLQSGRGQYREERAGTSRAFAYDDRIDNFFDMAPPGIVIPKLSSLSVSKPLAPSKQTEGKPFKNTDGKTFPARPSTNRIKSVLDMPIIMPKKGKKKKSKKHSRQEAEAKEPEAETDDGNQDKMPKKSRPTEKSVLSGGVTKTTGDRLRALDKLGKRCLNEPVRRKLRREKERQLFIVDEPSPDQDDHVHDANIVASIEALFARRPGARNEALSQPPLPSPSPIPMKGEIIEIDDDSVVSGKESILAQPEDSEEGLIGNLQNSRRSIGGNTISDSLPNELDHPRELAGSANCIEKDGFDFGRRFALRQQHAFLRAQIEQELAMLRYYTNERDETAKRAEKLFEEYKKIETALSTAEGVNCSNAGS